MAHDGIVIHFSGPYKATAHDAKMLCLLQLQQQLDIYIAQHRELCLYGDAANGRYFPWIYFSTMSKSATE